MSVNSEASRSRIRAVSSVTDQTLRSGARLSWNCVTVFFEPHNSQGMGPSDKISSGPDAASYSAESLPEKTLRAPHPLLFRNCSFHEVLSPMNLQLLIPKDLRDNFSQLRIPKGLRPSAMGHTTSLQNWAELESAGVDISPVPPS